MSFLMDVSCADAAYRIGWTLLHSLWQCAVVAIVLAVALQALRTRSANARYMVACAGLATMFVGFVVTLFVLPTLEENEASTVAAVGDGQIESVPASGLPQPSASHHIPPDVAVVEGLDAGGIGQEDLGDQAKALARAAQAEPDVSNPSLSERATSALNPWIPWIAAGWLLGVLLLSVWNVGGWLTARRLRLIGVSPVEPDTAGRFAKLVDRLKVSRTVRLLRSAVVEVPITVGWLRPTILLPLGLITGLTPSELDAIIVHELAHIRRHDYLVNLLQIVIETLLFYHPAVWWLSRRIRIERENCCDDWAVAVTGDSLSYARTLTRFGELRHAGERRLSVGQAVSADGGSLLSRVRRLLPGPRDDHARPRTWLAGSMALVMVAILVVTIGYMSSASGVANNGTGDSVEWHRVGAGDLAAIDVAETLYEQPGESGFFIRVRVSNVADQSVGVELKDFWKAVYVNSTHASDAPGGPGGYRGPFRRPSEFDTAARAALLTDFGDGKLAVIGPGRTLEYYHRFRHSGRKRIEQKVEGHKYFVIGLGGEALLSDGVQTEQIACSQTDMEPCVSIRAPVPWGTIPDNAHVISDATKPPDQEVDWGEPLNGTQTRLRADKAVWDAGEAPMLHCDLRHEGKRPQSWCLQAVEVDGSWYHVTDRPRQEMVITPGQTISNIPVVLNRRLIHAELGARFRLRPGKLTLRARIDIGPVSEPKSGGVAMGPGWDMFTNAVEITVQAGKEEDSVEGEFTVDDIAELVRGQIDVGGMLDLDTVPAATTVGEWTEGFDLKLVSGYGRTNLDKPRIAPRPSSTVRIMRLDSDEIVDAFRQAHRRREEIVAQGTKPVAADGLIAVFTDGVAVTGSRSVPVRLAILKLGGTVFQDNRHIENRFHYRWWYEKVKQPKATTQAEVFINNHGFGRKNGLTGSLKHTGSAECGHPGHVSKVTWNFLKSTSEGDVYRFTRTYPADGENPDTTENTVTYRGEPIVIFEDDVQRIGIRPSSMQVTVTVDAVEVSSTGGNLEFRVAPYDPSAGKKPTLDAGALKSYRDWLKQGRTGNWWAELPAIGGRMPDHMWLPTRLKDEDCRELTTGQYNAKKYVLVSDVPGQVMLPDLDKEQLWGLARVYQDEDPRGKPSIGLEFDANGRKLIEALTKANLGSALAIVVDGQVLAAPVVRESLRDRAVITGDFTDNEVQELIKALRAGMPAGNAGVTPSVAHQVIYFCPGQGQLSAKDLAAHPNIVVAKKFDEVKAAAKSLVAIWIDKDAVKDVDLEWLHKAPQKYYPIVVVGYCSALYSFQDLVGIGDPEMEWEKVKQSPGFSVRMLTSKTRTDTSAIMRGYEDAPTVTEVLKVTAPLLEESMANEAVPWGRMHNGLQCRLSPDSQTVRVAKGAKPEEIEVFVRYDLRNTGDEPLKFLPSATPLWRHPDAFFRVVDAKGDPVRFLGEVFSEPPATRDDFVTIGPGEILRDRVRLRFDLTKPGTYHVLTGFRMGMAEPGYDMPNFPELAFNAGDFKSVLSAYYGKDAERTNRKPDGVWRGSLMSNTVTIDVVAADSQAENVDATDSPSEKPDDTATWPARDHPPVPPGNRLASGDPGEEVQFGPVVERELKDGQFFDFTTGRICTPPTDLDLNDGADVLHWAKQSGADMRFVFESGTCRLQRLNNTWTAYLQPGNDSRHEWDNRTPESLPKLIGNFVEGAARHGALPDPETQAREWGPSHGIPIPGKDLPWTHFLVAGRILGMLQITGVSESPPGVKIRYRLLVTKEDVKDEADEAPKVEQPTEGVGGAKTSTPEAANSEDIAWGKLVDGLQLGLRFAGRHQPCWVGESVGFELHVRNLTDKQVVLIDHVSSPEGEPVFLYGSPTLLDSTGRPAPGPLSGDIEGPTRERRTMLPPGGSRILGGISRELDADPGPFHPGKYRASLTYRFDERPGATWWGELTTGELTLTVSPTQSDGPSVSPQAAAYYLRRLHEQYRTQIRDAVKAGNESEVARLTDKLNESINGRLLYVRVTRIDGPDKTSTLINRHFRDWPIKLPQIHYASSKRPHVTIQRPDNGDAYVLIETNSFGNGWYADDIHVVMALEPAERAWGKPVEGVQARLRPVHPEWRQDAVVRLVAGVRNQGQRDLMVAQAQELCELEIDGRRYRWAGDIDVKSSWFPPGRHYDNIQISLVKDWKCGDEPLALKPGKHSVRVWFVAEPTEKDRVTPFALRPTSSRSYWMAKSLAKISRRRGLNRMSPPAIWRVKGTLLHRANPSQV